ncbi:NF038104 family lipoprotein [Henriciella sp. AS95]|uniref:NF038104 family lipoprotein n=1 Tax=Henriciella sp. AS95 TaxID=3135782 RepID=UPI003170C117
MTRLLAVSALLAASLALSGCIVRTAVGVAGDVAEGAVNVTGAAVGAVIPDGDDDKDKD